MTDIFTYPLGPLQTNGYLLTNGNKALFVDPGGDPEPVLKHIKEHDLTLEVILNTHMHFDHVGGNKILAEATGAEILGSSEDEFLLQTPVGTGEMMGLAIDSFGYTAIKAGDSSFIGLECKVLETPGHTPGSLSFFFPEAKAVFVGDLLFRNSIGRTDFPGGSLETLLHSVKFEIFTLPADTVVYSGHGEATDVHTEATHNPFFFSR